MKKQLDIKRNMSDEDLAKLQKTIQIENVIYPRSYLWLQLFEHIYNQYEHGLSREEFAEKIFCLNDIEFFELKNGEFVKVYNEINDSNMQVSKSVLEKVVEVLITYGNISEYVSIELQIPLERAKEYIDMLLNNKIITMEWCGKELARRMYKAGKSIDEIYYEVWIEKEKVDEVIQEEKGLFQEIEASSIIRNESLGESKLSERELKRRERFKKNRISNLKKTENRVRKILQEYYYIPRNVEFIENYIKECEELFDTNEFPEEKLDLLCECISFAQSGFESIQFLVKAYIAHRKYQKAVDLINENIDNADVSDKEKDVLNEMKKQLKYSIQKEIVTNKILEGNTDVKALSEENDVLEVDVIHIRNSILKRKKEGLVRSNNEGETK